MRPTESAILLTVFRLSPEISLTFTLLSLKKSIIFLASRRISSFKVTKPNNSDSLSVSFTTARTREVVERSEASFRSLLSFRRNSGAPMRKVAVFVLTPLYFRSDEKGMGSKSAAKGEILAFKPSLALSAILVALSAEEALKIDSRAFFKDFSVWFSAEIKSSTVIFPVVRVPVLSRAIQSTRAKVSIE